MSPAGADEVGDLYLVGLAVPVDPADALFEPVGVERDVVVDDPVAVPLQVDALAGGVGGEQDPHRVAVGVGLERGLEVLALVLVHAAEQQAEPVPAQAPRASGCPASHCWVARYSVKTMTRSSVPSRRPGGRRG